MRIVVVEDNAPVAAIIIEAMRDAGHRVVGHARTIDHSAKLLENVECDAAILDIDLLGINTKPIAAALKAKRIPFVVISGSEHMLAPAHRGAPFVAKPFKLQTLTDAVETLRLPKTKPKHKLR